MSRITYAQAMADALNEAGHDTINRGSYGFIDGVYSRVKAANPDSSHFNHKHPLARQEAVMKAVSRSPLFERVGRIKLGMLTEHERWYPVFRLKGKDAS